MFGRFLPREEDFFDFFHRQAELTVRAMREFAFLSHPGGDVLLRSKAIRDVESEASDVKRQCVEALHKTFITPIDRDDIFQLTARVRDIVTLVRAASDRIVLYKLTSIPPEVGALADVLVQIALELERALFSLRSMNNAPSILDNCKRVQQLEREAEAIAHRAVGKLFEEEEHTRMVIKWKEVYDKIEKALGRCSDVSSILEGIILEHV